VVKLAVRVHTLGITGITGYVSSLYIHYNPMKKGFDYQPDEDIFKCTEEKKLSFSRLIYKKGTGFYRL
jgi:hypothetical protein